MRYLLALLILSCSGQHYPPPFPAPDTGPLVSIMRETPFGFASVCSGVAIDRGVLTAAHCVDGDTVYVSGSRSGNGWSTPVESEVLRVDYVEDLALVAFHSPRTARVSLHNAEVGTEVAAMGSPGYTGTVVTRGHVSSGLRVARDGGRVQYVDAGIINGMSGGPVVDSRQRVVGIVSFMVVVRTSVGQHPNPVFGGVVPASSIHTFLLGIPRSPQNRA